MELHGIIIANSQHNDDELVAEIWVENKQIAEVYFEGDQSLIEFFPIETGKTRLSYNEFTSMINKVNEFVSNYMSETEYRELK